LLTTIAGVTIDDQLQISGQPLKISHLIIERFRGISKASLFLPDHTVLIGDNNTGKSTILEAIDLALGPDRLSRHAPVDEYDFHLGKYLAEDTDPAAAPATIPSEEIASDEEEGSVSDEEAASDIEEIVLDNEEAGPISARCWA
jgi:putative ATP-dependent endonuclease of OLD family